ncbi:hypothetical protein PUMCH_001937 [Australozyma saopauloensis]|uniref:Uncharacterized protein n=1 Tax=Australozyma saopauloensis TaxID=291208 RepID=A0AAX4H9S9_9ASCO|nr:hypothetical protein PUMCH_001937 [[Candida] saopauloensis]
MKFTLASTVLAASSLAAADTIYFSVQDLASGKLIGSLYDAHELAGGQFFFVGSNPAYYDFDPVTKSVGYQLGSLPYKLGKVVLNGCDSFWGVFATIGGPGEALCYDSTGLVTNYNFWACSNVNDPYKYSWNSKVIMINALGNNTAPYPTCNKVNIYKKDVAAPPGNKNGTWTSYTTYCPLPTVVTITTCGTQTCYPTAVTVTTATTVTCANCLVPQASTTVVVPPPVTLASVSTATTVIPPPKTVASASTSTAQLTITYTGAGVQNALGVAGVAGFAAAMLL